MPEQEAIAAFEAAMRENPDLMKLLADLQPTAKDLFPNEPAVHDWTYRDLPGRLSPDLWDKLLNIIGEGDFRIIVMSEGREVLTSDLGASEKVTWRRGQLLISPAGMQRLSDWREPAA